MLTTNCWRATMLAGSGYKTYFQAMPEENSKTIESLTGRLLIAMPHMGDPNFERTVVFMCSHGSDGAMGLVINREAESIDFDELLSQLNIESDQQNDIRVHHGGPVDTGRGFVLHSSDYFHDGSVEVTNDIAMTATVEILRSIAGGDGPRKHLLALGYAGWAPGQLENEIQANGWLVSESSEQILFDLDLEAKWKQAMSSLGIDPALLTSAAGRA